MRLGRSFLKRLAARRLLQVCTQMHARMCALHVSLNCLRCKLEACSVMLLVVTVLIGPPPLSTMAK